MNEQLVEQRNCQVHELDKQIAVLEERLKGSARALELARSNEHAIRAEVLAVVSVLVSVCAIWLHYK